MPRNLQEQWSADRVIKIGTGLVVTNGTLSNSGIVQVGTATGTITLGAGLVLSGGTLSANGVGLTDFFPWACAVAETVVADTYVLAGYAPFAGAFSALKAVVGPAAVGSLTETLAINGTPVTGVNAVTVNAATVQTFTATAANTFAIGDKITLVVAVASGVPVGAWSTALFTRA